MIYYVYVIKSLKNGNLYVGLSYKPLVRLYEHNMGRVFSTKGYRPWKLVFLEKVGDRILARKREKYLKSGVGKEYLKNFIN